jgi:hypothetical protein
MVQSQDASSMSNPMIGPDGELLITAPETPKRRRWWLWILIGVFLLLLVGLLALSAYDASFTRYNYAIVAAWGAEGFVCGSWKISGETTVVDYGSYFVRAWTDDGQVLNGGIYDDGTYRIHVPKHDGILNLHVALMDRARQRSEIANIAFGTDNTCEYHINFVG